MAFLHPIQHCHPEWMASINLIGSIPGIFLVFLWPIVRKKIGKKGFFYLFLVLFIIGTLIIWAWSLPQFKNQTTLGYIGRFLQQWGLTAATVHVVNGARSRFLRRIQVKEAGCWDHQRHHGSVLQDRACTWWDHSRLHQRLLQV